MKVLFILGMIILMSMLVFGFTSGFSDYTATAYCLRGKTASGHRTQRGIIAADPRRLKLGATVYIRAGKYSGKYVVRDTGANIKGRRIDVWLPSRAECLTFGRKSVTLKVI